MGKTHRYITTRNHVAVAAHFRKGGSHGGTVRSKNRKDRKAARQESRTWKGM